MYMYLLLLWVFLRNLCKQYVIVFGIYLQYILLQYILKRVCLIMPMILCKKYCQACTLVMYNMYINITRHRLSGERLHIWFIRHGRRIYTVLRYGVFGIIILFDVKTIFYWDIYKVLKNKNRHENNARIVFSCQEQLVYQKPGNEKTVQS